MTFTILVLGFWLVCNIVVACMMTREEMYQDFIEEQSFVGRILANTFYWLAWAIQIAC